MKFNKNDSEISIKKKIKLSLFLGGFEISLKIKGKEAKVIKTVDSDGSVHGIVTLQGKEYKCNYKTVRCLIVNEIYR